MNHQAKIIYWVIRVANCATLKSQIPHVHFTTKIPPHPSLLQAISLKDQFQYVQCIDNFSEPFDVTISIATEIRG